MSHAYDIECEHCGCKFCDCHPSIIREQVNGELIQFCDETCEEKYEDEWSSDKKWALKPAEERRWKRRGNRMG